jgi:hypothetical protein
MMNSSIPARPASQQVEVLFTPELNGRNRKTVFFRYILVAPIALLAGLLTVSLFLPVLLSLLFRKRYPSYALTFNHALLELHVRIAAYIYLLTDDYPSIERNPKIAVLFPDIEGGAKLSRGLPLIKWFLAIPLIVVGYFYSLAALVITLIAWIKVSATGAYPAWGLRIVVGSVKFWSRIAGYAFILVTDEYPSFKL